jgi:hypothetical protein
MSDSAATRLPKPIEKMKTPVHFDQKNLTLIVGPGLTNRENLAGRSKTDTETPDGHDADAASNQK